MNRILLLIDHPENRRLLEAWLRKWYQVIPADSKEELHQPFDLGMIDGPALSRLSKEVQTRKAAERPRFLPFILAVSRTDVNLFKQHLWESVDELIIHPVDQMELQVRIEVLLRSRQFSSELKLRNDDLEAYSQALMHDLRAPVRAIGGFAKLLVQEQKGKLDERGKHHLDRIQSVAEQAWDMIDALLNFSRLGQKEIILRRVRLHSIIESCLRNLQEEIEAANAQIVIRGELASVQADPTLLKMALNDLLSNAIKYVPPGKQPHVILSTSISPRRCRIHIQDNGIGLSSENQQRIFSPFVRLHSVEEYPGIGLGLSTVRKVVELMGGQVGVESAPDRGSLFWIELGLQNEEPHGNEDEIEVPYR